MVACPALQRPRTSGHSFPKVLGLTTTHQRPGGSIQLDVGGAELCAGLEKPTHRDPTITVGDNQNLISRTPADDRSL